MKESAYLGIDVAKTKLMVMLLHGKRKVWQQVANTADGYASIVAWLKGQAVEIKSVCLEATGYYGDGVASALHQAGYPVSVVNPAQIKAFAKMSNARQKTDKADAELIARFAALEQVSFWQPFPPEMLELRSLMRHLMTLDKDRQQARNRLKAGNPSATVRHALQAQIDFLTQQMAHFQRQVQTFISQHPTLKALCDRLSSIKGIGALTASRLMAEIGDINRFDSKEQLVAFVGLDPSHFESGTSVKQPTHISKKGNAHLRTALYFPAIVAKNHNPLLQNFCRRLRERGKSPKEIVVAVMKKLLHIVFGVWKSGQPFDPLFLHKFHRTA